MVLTQPKTNRKAPAEVPAEVRRDWLRMMMLIREFELRTMQAYQEARIGGFCHIYIGQEAVAVGAFAALRPDDPVIVAYRDHGHALARGMEPRYAMAEMFGKVGGCSKGKGGSMHLFDARNHFYGGHAIVGGHLPVAAGMAFALKYQNEVLGEDDRRVVMCLLGDGALNIGSFHEAMNLAAIYSLPVIFAVENNRYAMGTSIERGTSMANDLSAKAGAYGMAYREYGGMDAVEVYEHTKEIVDYCRHEQKPAFVNIETYRYKGHSMSDPQKYRSKEEVAKYEEGDPIRRLAEQLKEQGHLDDEAFKNLSNEVRQEVREAIEWAEQSPDPDPATDLYADVVAEPFDRFGPTSPPSMLTETPEGTGGVSGWNVRKKR